MRIIIKISLMVLLSCFVQAPELLTEEAKPCAINVHLFKNEADQTCVAFYRTRTGLVFIVRNVDVNDMPADMYAFDDDFLRKLCRPEKDRVPYFTMRDYILKDHIRYGFGCDFRLEAESFKKFIETIHEKSVKDIYLLEIFALLNGLDASPVPIETIGPKIRVFSQQIQTLGLDRYAEQMSKLGIERPEFTKLLKLKRVPTEEEQQQGIHDDILMTQDNKHDLERITEIISRNFDPECDSDAEKFSEEFLSRFYELFELPSPEPCVITIWHMSGDQSRSIICRSESGKNLFLRRLKDQAIANNRFGEYFRKIPVGQNAVFVSKHKMDEDQIIQYPKGNIRLDTLLTPYQINVFTGAHHHVQDDLHQYYAAIQVPNGKFIIKIRIDDGQVWDIDICSGTYELNQLMDILFSQDRKLIFRLATVDCVTIGTLTAMFLDYYADREPLTRLIHILAMNPDLIDRYRSRYAMMDLIRMGVGLKPVPQTCISGIGSRIEDFKNDLSPDIGKSKEELTKLGIETPIKFSTMVTAFSSWTDNTPLPVEESLPIIKKALEKTSYHTVGKKEREYGPRFLEKFKNIVE